MVVVVGLLVVVGGGCGVDSDTIAFVFADSNDLILSVSSVLIDSRPVVFEATNALPPLGRRRSDKMEDNAEVARINLKPT